MADIVDRETRSRMMRGIRGQDTKLEVRLRSALHRRGFRFRKNVRDLPGKPDIVLKRYHAAIFAHGCFWHGHDCNLFRLPTTRTDFWREKIEGNQARDARTRQTLHADGWRILTVWECAVRGIGSRSFDQVAEDVAAWLTCHLPSTDIRGNADGAG